jgi:hypothetical protein
MEPLRIRIPDVKYCDAEDCLQLTRNHVCDTCASSHSSMSEEVSPATLPCEPKVVHRPPLRRLLRRRGKVHQLVFFGTPVLDPITLDQF